MTGSMTHRERLLRAVSLKEPDRVPMDLGGHTNSSIHILAYQKLKNTMGIDVDKPTTFVSKMMQDVAVQDDILNALDIDTRGVFHGSCPSLKDDDDEWIDEFGVARVKPQGAYYYDMVRAPLSGQITVQDIARYPWPPKDFPDITKGLKEQIQHWRETTDCAIVLNVPSAFVHQSQYMRGFEDWFMDLAGDPKLAEAMFDACLEVRMAWGMTIMDAVGRDVDIILTSDDMGTQTGLQFSPSTYRKLLKPRHAKYWAAIRERTHAPLMLHSCGSIYEILPDLIDMGIQIINPVQTRAANMAPEKLKKEFGDRLAFWGGVDIQEVMPFGSPEDVRNEVNHLFETLGKGGGWVLCPSHNLQPEIPPENIIALYKAGQECRYS